MKGKRLAAVFMAAACLCTLLAGCQREEVAPAQAAAGNALRIMSFNVAGFSGNPFQGTWWTGRVSRFAQCLNSRMPDSVGTQEMAAKWLKKLETTLPQYAAVGVARDDGKEEGEFNTILYLKEKYELVDSGTFWLSKTPDTPSKYDDETGCMRICTYAVLKNKKTGKTYAHINTHFDNVSAEAREFGARMVLSKAQSFSVPVVITGDFNCSTEEAPYMVLAGGYSDTRKLAKISDTPGSYHAWGENDPPWELDYCLVSADAFTVNTYQVLRNKINGKFVSDHYAVYTEMELK